MKKVKILRDGNGNPIKIIKINVDKPANKWYNKEKNKWGNEHDVHWCK